MPVSDHSSEVGDKIVESVGSVTLPSGDISPLIFRQIVGENLKDVSLDGRLLSLFLALDGEKSLGALAQTIGLSPEDLRITVTRLLELQLIEPLEKEYTYLDPEFLGYLTLQYAKAIGPLARILIEEEAFSRRSPSEPHPEDAGSDSGRDVGPRNSAQRKERPVQTGHGPQNHGKRMPKKVISCSLSVRSAAKNTG